MTRIYFVYDLWSGREEKGGEWGGGLEVLELIGVIGLDDDCWGGEGGDGIGLEMGWKWAGQAGAGPVRLTRGGRQGARRAPLVSPPLPAPLSFSLFGSS